MMPDRNLTGQYFLAIQLGELSLLLRGPEVIAVSRAIADLSTDASDWSFDDHSGPRHTRKFAEARACTGIAPHLSPSEFFRRFITRPVNALDSVRFITRPVNALDSVGIELWFASVPQDEKREIITLLHTPPNRATLYRILWALPHLEIPLSESDRDRLVHLAGSDDAKARSGAM